MSRFARILMILLLGRIIASPALGGEPDDHFEKKIRPLLLEKCAGCHNPEKRKGGLILDGAGIARGGDSGQVLVPGQPGESLLIRSIRQEGDLKMPPGGKLKETEIAAIESWVKQGAHWPESTHRNESPGIAALRPMAPDAPALVASLQAWYRADLIPLADGQPVLVWPDRSGHGRDLTITRGVRAGGVGGPATWVSQSALNGRSAVRFDSATGLASSPDNPVPILGDAPLSLFLVVHLKPTQATHPHDSVVGWGDPANSSGDPGKPLGALVQISRKPEPELMLAGGWNHDATLGQGSCGSLYHRSTLLSIVRQSGPLGPSTRFYFNGVSSELPPLARKTMGSVAIPDFRSRKDIGVFLGKALVWCGGFEGDVGEIIIYNRALDEKDRVRVEMGLAERFALIHPEFLTSTRAVFSDEQKAFWSFQKPKSTTPPRVASDCWGKSPLDHFILERLEKAGLGPAPFADKRTLLRRVTFGLTGLPPTSAEIEAFHQDERPDAFEAVVDRLLASPHYGEHWGRHWLDVARFAETTANDANAVMRYAWRYRDYVVRAFNEDKPYDRFIIEQLAGDLLPSSGDLTRDAERVIATGFLMVGPKALAETDKEQSRRDIIDDQIDTIGRAFLGLTIACARCHDHKFDPIPTVDYYALAGILRGTEVFLDENRNATMWQERTLPQVGGEQPMVVMAPKDSRSTLLPVAIRGNHLTPGIITPRRFPQILAGVGHPPIDSPQSGRLELARWIASKENPLTARVLVNRIWQHHFGTGLVATSDNFGARGDKPSHPELLDWLAEDFIANGWSIKKLHKRILLSSVYQTSSRPGEALIRHDPTNRWLGRFPRQRLSAESVRDAMLAVSGQLDRTVGGNDSGELLFKEAESIGALIRPNRLQTNHPIYLGSKRRTLYLPLVRNAVPDALTLFDGADPNALTAQRNDTTVASQGLYLLNHPFVRDQAAHFATRILAPPKDPDPARVVAAFVLALNRPPSDAEIQDTLAFLESYQSLAVNKGRSPVAARHAAWQSFCQTLLCRNEFLYVD